MDTVRWGIVGPGRIADKVVRDLPLVEGATAVAVASRSADRAAAFASRHDIPRTHDSYRAIVDDPDVDVLYIATPHPQHRAVALAALRAGKAVLVEKAFTVTPEATREIAAVAPETGVFAMEAMWTRFQPAIVRLRELIADGAVGEVRSRAGRPRRAQPAATRTTGSSPRSSAAARCSTSTVYPISFAQMVLGNPTAVTAHGTLLPTRDRPRGDGPARLRRRTHRRAAPPRCGARRPGRPGCSAPTAGSTCSRASTTPTRSCCTATATTGGDHAARDRWRVLPRADRGHRVRRGRPPGERRPCRSPTPSPCRTSWARSPGSSGWLRWRGRRTCREHARPRPSGRGRAGGGSVVRGRWRRPGPRGGGSSRRPCRRAPRPAACRAPRRRRGSSR